MQQLKTPTIEMWLRAFVLSAFLMTSPVSQAGKLDVMAGWFNLSAETDDAEDELSTVGAYRINYLMQILPMLELGVGYTLLLSQTVSGDMGFGFDIGFFYYPLTQSSRVSAQSENATVQVDPLWRPYIGAGFHQRQFQSVQSTYAGFSLAAGIERALKRSFNVKGEFRYGILQGAGSSTATEMTLVGGFNFIF